MFDNTIKVVLEESVTMLNLSSNIIQLREVKLLCNSYLLVAV